MSYNLFKRYELSCKFTELVTFVPDFEFMDRQQSRELSLLD
jgi:hypothetical protein